MYIFFAKIIVECDWLDTEEILCYSLYFGVMFIF